MIDLKSLPQIVAGIGALGTAAYGLLDASKAVLPWNNIGFARIKKTAQLLTPGKGANTLSQDQIIDTLHANWINGADLGSQKSIAKSLVKLNLSPANATDLAKVTGLEAETFHAVATKIKKADPKHPLSDAENDIYGRFDFIITALLDDTYQHADNLYTNSMRIAAGGLAVALAVIGGLTINLHNGDLWQSIWQSVIVGLLATPLAPIAKDLSTALATAVNTMQLVKK